MSEHPTGMSDETPTLAAPKRRRSWIAPLLVALIATVFVAIAVVIVVPLIWPVPPLTGTVPPTQLASKTDRFVMIDGTLVRYQLYGSADATCTVLLLHGFGASAFSWRDVAPALGKRCQVVVMDRPGFGLTQRQLPPSGWAWQEDSPYSFSSQAQLAYGLLDRLGVERAAIVGHSQGAGVAVTMAALSPQRVTALVLVAPAIGAGGPVPSWAAAVLRTPQGRRIGPLLVRGIAGDSSDEIIRRSFADPSSATDEVLEGYRLPLQAQDWDVGLWEQSISAQPVRPDDVLGQLGGIPVLVIVPGGDQIVAPEQQRETAAAIPGARVVEAEGQGHLYHEEEPGVFAQQVADFVRSAEPTTQP